MVKLDGVGPFDNKPSVDYLDLFVKLKIIIYVYIFNRSGVARAVL